MTERFLHYLWKMKLLRNNALATTEGESILIISAGDHNADAGPDFQHARIKIGATLWVGNVEIHIKSSDWDVHHHDEDKAYDNIILHVVYENNQPIRRSDGSLIPCLEIRDHIDSAMYETYQSLMQSHSWIPCEQHIHKAPAITIQQWLHRLLVERMEEKIQPILHALQENQNNWEETFYQFLAMSYGARVNAEPFHMLARALPVKVLAKHKNSVLQLEALLFGTAGFLDEKFSDDYPNQLKKEFNFLKMKYGLNPLKKHVWKFLRLRPANFPTVRLAQFAQLIFKSSHLFSKILESADQKIMTSFFETETSSYWTTHYRFDKEASEKKKTFGTSSTGLLFINTIVPFLFVYGKLRDEEEYCERALWLLEHLSAEENNIIEGWGKVGIKARNAFETQALLQLRNNYCKNFRCLDCAIGHQVLLQGSLTREQEKNV